MGSDVGQIFPTASLHRDQALVCEKGKSVPRISIWHHKACRMLTKGDPGGRIFLSHPHMIKEFFFSLSEPKAQVELL